MTIRRTCRGCGCGFERPAFGPRSILLEVYCPDCADLIMRQNIWARFGATQGQDHVICPWCGYEHEDSEYWDFDGELIHECDQCKKPIEVTILNRPTFDSCRPRSTMPPDFKPEPGDYEL